MNHLTLVGQLADAPTYTRPEDGGPARTAFTIGVPRRGSTAVDWVGVTAVGAPAHAVTAADPGAGAVVAVEGYLHATSPGGDGRYQLDVVAIHVQVLSPGRKTQQSQEVTP